MTEASVQKRCNSHLPLPPEIRNEIYRYAFFPKYKVGSGGDLLPKASNMTGQALLRVSKATNQEVKSLFYGEGEFRVCIYRFPHDFDSLRAMDATFGLIRNLTLDISGCNPLDIAGIRTGIKSVNFCIGKLSPDTALCVRCHCHLVGGECLPPTRKAFVRMLRKLKDFRKISIEVVAWPLGFEVVNKVTTKVLRFPLGKPVKKESVEPVEMWWRGRKKYSPTTRYTFSTRKTLPA